MQHTGAVERQKRVEHDVASAKSLAMFGMSAHSKTRSPGKSLTATSHPVVALISTARVRPLPKMISEFCT